MITCISCLPILPNSTYNSLFGAWFVFNLRQSTAKEAQVNGFEQFRLKSTIFNINGLFYDLVSENNQSLCPICEMLTFKEIVETSVLSLY